MTESGQSLSKLPLGVSKWFVSCDELVIFPGLKNLIQLNFYLYSVCYNQNGLLLCYRNAGLDSLISNP